MNLCTEAEQKKLNNDVIALFSKFQFKSPAIGRGGAREGAGRKPKRTARNRRTSSSLTDSLGKTPEINSYSELKQSDCGETALDYTTDCCNFLASFSTNSIINSTDRDFKEKPIKKLFDEFDKKEPFEDPVHVAQYMEKQNFILPKCYSRILRKFILVETEVKELFRRKRRITYRKVREQILWDTKE